MKITQEEVTHVANLSKLKFSPEERQLSLRQPCLKLSTWWNCWKKWTQQVLPQIATMADRKTVLRPDVAEKGLTVTACLKTYLKR